MRGRTARLIGVILLVSAISATARADDDVHRAVVDHGGNQTEFLKQGKGPAIVLLPSLGRAPEDFDAVSKSLSANGFTVLRPVPRGMGRSTGPMTGVTMHDLAADVAAVVEQSGQAPVVVGGHAFGNFVARQLATDRPELVSGVVLMAASPGKVPAGSSEKPIGPEMRKAIDGSSDLSLPTEERLEYLRAAFFAPGHDASIWLDGWNQAVHHVQSEARERTPVDDYFAAGRAPILDLQAENDPVAPRRFASVLKDRLGDRVTIVVVANASHALVPEQPAAVVQAITDFARKVSQK